MGSEGCRSPREVGSACGTSPEVSSCFFFFFPDESFDEDDFDEEAYYAALGTRPALNVEELDPSYQRMIELFSICTSEEPQKRPSAARIVAALEASLPPQ